MNGAYQHLLINHIPVLGSFIGTLILLWGILRKSREVQQVAFAVLLVGGLMGWLADSTGDKAKEVVKNIAGVNTDAIDAHDEAASRAKQAGLVLAVASLAGLIWMARKPQIPGWYALIVLVVALGVSGMMGYTAKLGGKIRHSETESSPATTPSSVK